MRRIDYRGPMESKTRAMKTAPVQHRAKPHTQFLPPKFHSIIFCNLSLKLTFPYIYQISVSPRTLETPIPDYTFTAILPEEH